MLSIQDCFRQCPGNDREAAYYTGQIGGRSLKCWPIGNEFWGWRVSKSGGKETEWDGKCPTLMEAQQQAIAHAHGMPDSSVEDLLQVLEEVQGLAAIAGLSGS
jgi:hypothetical protein